MTAFEAQVSRIRAERDFFEAAYRYLSEDLRDAWT